MAKPSILCRWSSNAPLRPAPAPCPAQTKHVKPTAQGESGQIVKKEFPVHHSNVQLYSNEKQVSSRIGYK